MSMLHALAALVLLHLPYAQAQETEEPQEDEPAGGWVTVGEAPTTLEAELEDAVWENLTLLPPRVSWELGIGATFSDVSYWRGLRSYTGAFPGLGAQLGYGRHIKNHRLGGNLAASVEGPVPLYYSFALEAMPSWDYVSHGVLIGASAGAAVVVQQALDEDSALTAGPVIALRIGPSQPWSRLGRRLFVVAEPRLRLIQGYPNASLAILVGQGRGK